MGGIKAYSVIQTEVAIERHPWKPFAPVNAKILFLGTFPPKPHRWKMEFYYPNPTNDFWKIMGLIFNNNPVAFYDPVNKNFRLGAIKELLEKEGIALGDTARAVRRLRDNASDKFLDIIEEIDLEEVLSTMPKCCCVVSTGEKAATIVAKLTETQVPKTGEFIDTFYEPLKRNLRIWRMPSSSRAYPLALQKKAEYYSRLFV